MSNDWKTRVFVLVEKGKTPEALALLQEFVVGQEDTIEVINQLSCLAIDFMDEPSFVNQLDYMVRSLERTLR